jgi:uncharacterized sulfatase
MNQLADDLLWINGWWSIDVNRPGNFRIKLSRFPEDNSQPIKAASARLRIGEKEWEQSLNPMATHVEFLVELPAGPQRLQSWFYEAGTSKSRGAYFVQVKFIKP